MRVHNPILLKIRTSEYVGFPPKDAVAFSLSDLGLSNAQTVLMKRQGAYKATSSGNDTSVGISGIFSSTSELLGAVNPSTTPGTLVYTPLERVTGALATTLPNYVSKPSYHGMFPADPKTAWTTDVLEDFNISSAGVLVDIPVGANFIFFSANDNLFSDNSDPNKNFGVLISVVTMKPVSAPASLALMGVGFAGLCGFSRRRRKA